ncbi:unnamed protein product [Sphagnum jensenii]|uniref:phosphoglycerate mutase (2,3-diphosphoglycerate-dependent) n=1 Tax=Sphagnum jensenii TaxID=128206 RepID=A0ABP1BPL8_9BRYO
MDAITLALNISIWRASPISSHAIHTTQKHTPRDKNKQIFFFKNREWVAEKRKSSTAALAPRLPPLDATNHKQARTTRTPREPLDSREQSKILRETQAALILIRHGESLWNSKNLFTGCVDVPLSEQGVNEAIEAGKRISHIPVDMIFTSALIRAQMTAMLAMTQHCRQKVPVILHNESERAEAWSRIFSTDTEEQVIPVVTAWELNERMYGELQGLNKKETADKFGKDKVHEWRRSYDIPPPNGESLEMCAERAVAYFKDKVVPEIEAGRNVMIAAHGNSLRSIIMYLDKLTSQEVIELELSTGIPMLYTFKGNRFLRRGSPVGPTVAGVYALTEDLARYRDQLDSRAWS